MDWTKPVARNGLLRAPDPAGFLDMGASPRDRNHAPDAEAAAALWPSSRVSMSVVSPAAIRLSASDFLYDLIEAAEQFAPDGAAIAFDPLGDDQPHGFRMQTNRLHLRGRQGGGGLL